MFIYFDIYILPENDLFENIGNLIGNHLRLCLYLQIFISGKRGQQFAIERRSVTTFWIILFTMAVCALFFAGGIRKGREYFHRAKSPCVCFLHKYYACLSLHTYRKYFTVDFRRIYNFKRFQGVHCCNIMFLLLHYESYR